jgi:hypothetical protein
MASLSAGVKTLIPRIVKCQASNRGAFALLLLTSVLNTLRTRRDGCHLFPRLDLVTGLLPAHLHPSDSS